MRDVLERAYDESPYPDFAFWFTHPDHLAALGKVFGLDCPPIETCRVLEIGCAAGGNLLSIAASLPRARCVGVDLSGVQIAEARGHAEAAGLTNVTLVHGDFRELDPALGEFDFVICHGVYSWVDEATGQALLEAIRARLAPHGVAYVSYNTYPGWHMVEMVRRLMRLHTADAPDEASRLDQCMQITRWLLRRARMNSNDWRAPALEQELQSMKDAGKALMLHDYLAPFNRPLYFVDFLERAGQAGLTYVANASPWDMYLDNYDDDLSSMLKQVPDLVLQQQYLDFVFHSRFRRTLLARADAPVSHEIHADRVFGFFMNTGMFEDPGLDGVEAGLPMQVKVSGRAPMNISNAIARVALHLIWRNGRRPATFDELVAETRDHLARLGLEASMLAAPDADERLRARLAGQLLRVFFADAVKFGVARAPIARHIPDRPATGRFQRHMARTFDYSPNLWHEHFPIGEAARAVLQHMDGTRTWEELQALHPEPILETLGHLRQAGFILEPDEAAPYV
ncbi:MAG: class I SAM-dependent methyltransferase [Deltaproteobacteria bacterium]|nr:class I SAM-dependent methyltransferase [Deltaproteobacteria bacterium]